MLLSITYDLLTVLQIHIKKDGVGPCITTFWRISLMREESNIMSASLKIQGKPNPTKFLCFFFLLSFLMQDKMFQDIPPPPSFVSKSWLPPSDFLPYLYAYGHIVFWTREVLFRGASLYKGAPHKKKERYRKPTLVLETNNSMVFRGF